MLRTSVNSTFKRSFGSINLFKSTFVNTRRLYAIQSAPSSGPVSGSHMPGKKQVTVDVELPDVMAEKRKTRRSFILFLVTMCATFYGIVKYEDANSPVVSSTLYTLRRSPKAKEILGENIRFASLSPWVSGKISTLQGIVDFSFKVEGSKGSATVHFNARKEQGKQEWELVEWLIAKDGQTLTLMDEEYRPFVPGPKEEPTMRRNI